MSLFARLARAIFGGGSRDESAGRNAFWIYVQCDACGEKIRTRVSREHDLSSEFEGGDLPTGYYCHKEIIGQNCFRRIGVDLRFDSRQQLTEQEIKGGRFITQEEYESAEAGAPEAGSGAGA